MKIQDRFVRFAVALIDLRLVVAMTIIAVVAMLVPSRSSIAEAASVAPAEEVKFSTALALDDCTGGTGVNRGSTLLTTKDPIFVAALVTTVGGALGAGAGGSIRGAVLRAAPVYDVTTQNSAEFDLIAKIIRNAEQVNTYRANEQTTVFWPNNESLVRALGAGRVEALQQTANQAQAKQFLLSLTVPGSYNLEALKAAVRSAQVLRSATGQSVSLTMSGDKLFANGVEMVNSEYPATNGYVLVARGLISIPE